WGDLQNYTSEGRVYMEEFSRLMNSYRRQTERQEIELRKIQELFFSTQVVDEDDIPLLATNSPSTAVTLAGGLAGTVAGIGLATSIGLAIGGTILTGGILGLLGAGLAYFYLSSNITQLILNYMEDSRAFVMIPLMMCGEPMIAGTTFGYGSGMYKTPLQHVRQYWMDGGMGRSLEETDMIMRHANISIRNGKKIESALARFSLDWERFKFDLGNPFYDLGDFFLQKRLFPEGNKGDGSTANLISDVIEATD
ncbi:MAG: hypothetical protein EB127_31260, partial [Alphaproteobacteria bacterium]|nr:hypothetical protein [Alphaproteobacteria bacterium]